MKTDLVRCMTMVAVAFWVSSAAANSVDVNLEQFSGTNKLSGQLHLTIYDNDQSDQVLFSFTNDVGTPSSVEAIYINGCGLFSSIDGLYESHGVNFTTGGEGPFTLPGENPPGFSANYMVRAEGNASDGIDQAGEYLGIVFNLLPGVTPEEIFEHPPIVKVTPPPGGPGGTNPVPEPTSLVLFGIGTAGLAGLSKRRRNNK